MKVKILRSATDDLVEGYHCISRNIARVYAVIDCRKNPAWIRNRLAK